VEVAMQMPEWLERAAPGTLGVFLGQKASRRKTGLFLRHLCRLHPQAFTDPRSLAALDAADGYEAGEIDEPAYRVALQAAAQAQEEAQARFQATRDPQTGHWSGPFEQFSSAAFAASVAQEAASGAYSKRMLADLGRAFGVSSCPRSTARKRVASMIRRVFFEHFGDIQRPVVPHPSWRTELVVALAAGVYAERAFDRLPILADALLDAGCDNEDVLAHCRSDDRHGRGCWVLDLLLAKG
jgi:hypothetical protein